MGLGDAISLVRIRWARTQKKLNGVFNVKSLADDRMRSEHPASERDQVIRRGRVFGGLQPTRAFGDAVYKWNLEQGNA